MLLNNLIFLKSNTLSKKVYKQTLNLPHKYQSSIGDQLRRVSLSIILNIVEGGAQFKIKERLRFTRIAFASLKETKYLIYFLKEFNLIEERFHREIKDEINELAKILFGYLRKHKQT